MDLKSIFDPSKCTSFGSAYLKSRSSDSFTSAVKDFIAPQTVNISNCGTVIIKTVTIPSGATHSFSFTSNITTESAGVSIFSLNGSEPQRFSDVLAGGPYEVIGSDRDNAGWVLDDITCEDSDSEGVKASHTASILVNTGEEVVCTFTYIGMGRIIIEKQTLPAGDSAIFQFTGDVAGTLSDGDSAYGDSAYMEVVAGTYKAEEMPLAGWKLTDITCYGNNEDDSSGDTTTAIATFNVDPGETVRCVFTNTKLFTIITLVCHNGQLYASTAALGDGTPVPTLAMAPVEFNPCGLAGARFENNPTGNHPITVSISP